MKYYRVKKYKDFSDGTVLIKNELLTEKEKKKYPLHWFEEIECPISKTYLFFGARFAVEEEE